MIDRRGFGAVLAGGLFAIGRLAAAPLPRWRPGLLDIHHIATGRGDATLIVAPSGRMVLIDVGAARGTGPAMVDPLPDGAITPGRRVARYVKRRLAETRRSNLDALAITHFHDDHIGGVADLLAEIPVTTIFDRAWPGYGVPPFEGPAGADYAALMQQRVRQGGQVERLEVGRADQILPADNAIGIRTVAAAGVVWTGDGTGSRAVFPPASSLVAADMPNENACSAAFLVTLGRFRYFLGGDLTDWADAGTRPWVNALTPAARACGPVHVSTLPHHGMFDGSSVETIRALAARDWIISAWHAVHPSIETLERVYNPRVYTGPRDIWATDIHPATDLAISRLTRRFASRQGNVVCRVDAGGASWSIVATDPATDDVLTESEQRSVVMAVQS